MKNRENRQSKKGIFLPWRSPYVPYAHKKEGSKEEKDLEHELDTEIINL